MLDIVTKLLADAARMEHVLRVTKDRPAALARFVRSLADADRTQLRNLLTKRSVDA